MVEIKTGAKGPMLGKECKRVSVVLFRNFTSELMCNL
jgi:hypothetical protein